jgi:2-deoxy-D-gluconate 3-dehydrogenase
MGILDSFSLKGKVAIVTGSSTGLGQGISIGLAEAGADICGIDYVEQNETKEIITKLGVKYLSIKADLIHSSVLDLKELVNKAVSHFGHVDILVNNAGIIRREDILDFSESNWDDVMAINLKTIFFLTQAFTNQVIKEAHPGKVISICSMLSFQGGIRVPSYTASKSGLKGITMTFANELAKYNINVNAIAPGYMATNNTAALRDDEKRAGEILERIPAGRWGTPRDVAGAAVFLASSASDYVNGYTVAVDGGWLGR